MAGLAKTFWRRPWESRPRVFCSERSNRRDGCSRGCGYLPGMGLDSTGSTVMFPCASVRTAPIRSRSLNASAVCVCVMIAEGSDRNSLMCKNGVRPRRHLWFFRKRVLYSLIFERDSPQTSLSRSLHRMKRWTTVLSVLAQADWQCWKKKELSNLSQSRNNGVLILKSIHEASDFMHMNLITCIWLYAYALQNMHINLIICVSYFYLDMHFCICKCIFIFANAFLYLHMHYYVLMHYMLCHNTNNPFEGRHLILNASTFLL